MPAPLLQDREGALFGENALASGILTLLSCKPILFGATDFGTTSLGRRYD